MAQRVGADSVGPLSFSGARFALGSLLLLPVIWGLGRVRKVPRAKRRAATAAVILPGIAAGVMLTIGVNLQQAAMSDVPAGNAAFITGLYMVFVPVIAAFRGHRSSVATIVGVAASLVGLYLISASDGLSIGRGEWLLIVSTLFWAFQILIIEKYSPKLAALKFAATQFITCAVLSSIGALILEPQPFGGLGEAVIPVLYGGFLSVGIAFTLQVIGQRHALASHAALIMALESVFGAIGGALLLGENMGLRGYVGAALMVSGIVISQLGLARASVTAPPDREPVAT